MPNALHFESLSRLATDIRDGTISATDVTEHHLDRIARLEPRLHSFALVRDKEAREEAKAADTKRARGEPLGLLHGVPVAVKDLCAMSGTPTRAGGFFSTGFAPDANATVVRRLQEAGAVIIGKAQLTEGAWATHHPDVVDPVNPWVAQRWTGASSSGSGVAVAAGLAAGAIGTDTAGSIRFPSACTGLVGLKPTWGRVSRHGVFPLADTFDHVGPMTRTVADTALMFTAVAGPDPRDPTTLDAPLEDFAQAAEPRKLQRIKIGVDPEYSLAGLDEATTTSMKKALADLKAAGAEFIDVKLPPVDEILNSAFVALFAEAAIAHAATYPKEKKKYSAAYSALLDIGLSSPVTDGARAEIWRREFAGRMRRIFAGLDMIAIPVMAAIPFTIAEMKAVVGASPLAATIFARYTIPFNLAGLPALTLPMAPAPDGTPLGFQLIGPTLGERSLLSAGAAYEAVSGYVNRHPEL
jgi:amidase